MGHTKKSHKHAEKVFSIDIYAYNSHIKHWNATVKVVFAVTMMLLCILLDSLYVSVATIVICFYITVCLGKMPPKDYLLLLGVPIAFLILGSIVIAFDIAPVKRGILGTWTPWGYLYASNTSMMTILHLWGKAFGGISAMFMMSLSTPSSEIFSILRKLKTPALIIELMNMIYRFIFVMIDTFVRMNNAAESRLGYINYKTSLQTFGHIASNLLVVSLKKSNQYFDAMESRCYDGELLFLETPKEVSKEQCLYSVVSILLLLAIWLFTN